MNKQKSIVIKPMLYSVILEPLKKIALEFGYNLVLHGSMNRDMDLILIPWDDNCANPDMVVKSFNELLGGEIIQQGTANNPSISKPIFKGAGRLSYLINLNRSGIFNKYIDKEYYLDISVTPKVISTL